jgi:Cu+-exporting ATPase
VFILIWIIPYTDPEALTKHNLVNGVPLYLWLNAIFSTVIQIFIGAPFYISAFKSLKHKSANMDVLIVLGTTSAWSYGIAMISKGYNAHEMHDMNMYKMSVMENAHNFEVSSALITIILLGKYIETISKKKTVDQLSKLASLKVTKANLIDVGPNEPVSLGSKDKEIAVELV